MINIDRNDVKDLSDSIGKFLEEKFANPLSFFDYIERVLAYKYKKANKKYPYEIKIPKDLESLKNGDLEPSRIINITEPIMWKSVPTWFGDSSHQVDLDLGYMNGDSRKLCTASLSDKDIHMLLAGATGTGKSVTINDIIFGMCMHYAPWEIKLTLSDAKIVEFKAYAKDAKVPHIESIAATGDSDYLISVIKYKFAEMQKLNTVFANLGYKKIEDFRKATGLVIPQNILIFDEFQVMFAEAGKNLEDLKETIDKFARLGRNTGYHLILCSQQLGGDIPAKTLEQIKIRGALGCSANTSNTILNNEAAKENASKKGRLILNLEPEAENNERFNEQFKCPYINDDEFEELKNYLEGLGKRFDFSYPLTFYDEEDKLVSTKYTEYLKQFKTDPDIIYLGEPSYIVEDPEKVVKMRFNNGSVENIGIFHPNKEIQKRYSQMLIANIKKQGVPLVLIDGDELTSQDIGLVEAAGNLHFKTETVMEDADMYDSMIKLPFRRKLMLEVEDILFSQSKNFDVSSIASTTYQRALKESQFIMDTDYNLKRTEIIVRLLSKQSYGYNLGFCDKRGGKIMDRSVDNMIFIVKSLLQDYSRWGCASKRLYKSDMNVTYVWLSNLDQIIGLGISPSNADLTKLKETLLMSTKYKVRFILTGRAISDMTEIIDGIEYFFLENTPSRILSSIKCEDYPQTLKPVLGVLYTKAQSTGEQHCYKFKKMMYPEEV